MIIAILMLIMPASGFAHQGCDVFLTNFSNTNGKELRAKIVKAYDEVLNLLAAADDRPEALEALLESPFALINATSPEKAQIKNAFLLLEQHSNRLEAADKERLMADIRSKISEKLEERSNSKSRENSAKKALAEKPRFIHHPRILDSNDERFTFSGDQKLLFISDEIENTIYDTTTLQKISTIAKSETGEVIAAAFSNDGKWVAVSAKGGKISLFDLATGKRISEFKTPADIYHKDCFALYIMPGDEQFVSLYHGGNVVLWDIGKKTTLRSDYLGVDAFHLAHMKGSPLFAFVDNWDLKFWNSVTGETQRLDFKGSAGTHVANLTPAPDGHTLLLTRKSQIIHKIDSRNPSPKPLIADTKQLVYHLAIDPEEKYIFASSDNGIVLIYDYATGDLHGHLKVEGGNIRKMSVNGDKLIVVTKDGIHSIPIPEYEI